MDQAIKILIVDDYEMVRFGIRAYLEMFDDLVTIGEAANGVEAVDICNQLSPDVILMDVDMPVMDGVEATRVILEKFPNIHVIVLATFLYADRIQPALDAGAVNHILKDIFFGNLPELIRDAMKCDQQQPTTENNNSSVQAGD